MINNKIKVNLLDFSHQKIYSAIISWKIVDDVEKSSSNGMISKIERIGEEDPQLDYLLPGFIDAHVHIESSMMLPSEFARLAVRHGSIAAISDPHEIANVLGFAGIEFMLANSEKTPFHIYFGAPSCVPATPFETAGASISVADIEKLFASGKISYLSEMMNFPGVLRADEEVIAKLDLAKKYGFPIDGHAPGLLGEQAVKYAQAGISTDHECTTLEEARDKIAAGMKILIREGSAARDFDILHPLISECPDKLMFCSDDKHPDQLFHSHINQLVIRAVALGHDVFDVLKCACMTPIEHYQLPLGCLQVGQVMDAVLVDNLTDFTIKSTWLKGQKVAEEGQTLLNSVTEQAINCFKAKPIALEELKITVKAGLLRVIDVCEGKLFTREKRVSTDQLSISPNHLQANYSLSDKLIVTANPDNDLVQLTVLNRYQEAPAVNAFVSGTGLKSGAIASTVAHDSHNIIAMGCDQQAIKEAINTLIKLKGGICVHHSKGIDVLPLEVAGLMSLQSGEVVAQQYQRLDQLAKSLGFTLTSPFMTLSFLALLVIPELKLSDKGLFDGRDFSFKELTI
jgi:adenine deaminase